jgi:hypothetical protein
MNIILGLMLFLTLSHYAYAEDDDTQSDNKRTLIIQDGKVISEEHEVEVYDYHTGTFQTYKVYRAPEKKQKDKASKQPETAVKPQYVVAFDSLFGIDSVSWRAKS